MEKGKDMIKYLNYCGGIILQSSLDALSFQKSFPFLVNSSNIAKDFTQCILANGFLLLGSLYLFHKGIVPVTNYLQNEIVNEIPANEFETIVSITDFSIWSFYHTLWIFPIWIICYASSLGWYQSIASLSYQLQHGMPPARPLKQTIISTIYSTLVWFLTYLQAMFFYKIIPLLIHIVAAFVDYSLGHDSTHSLSFLAVFRLTLLSPLYLISFLSTLLGFIMVSILYGWYPYDMIWLSNPSPSTSADSSSTSSLTPFYNRVEVYWLYFFGYGLPYALLFRYSSFFVGYGIYLMVFPLSIMMSSVSDYHYRTASGKNQNVLPPFRIFRWSQYGAKLVLEYIHKYVMDTQKSRYRSSKKVQ